MKGEDDAPSSQSSGGSQVVLYSRLNRTSLMVGLQPRVSARAPPPPSIPTVHIVTSPPLAFGAEPPPPAPRTPTTSGWFGPELAATSGMAHFFRCVHCRWQFDEVLRLAFIVAAPRLRSTMQSPGRRCCLGIFLRWLRVQLQSCSDSSAASDSDAILPGGSQHVYLFLCDG